MAYSHTTWATLRTALAARLHDSSKLFYVDAELKLYLAEAMRTFSALSSFWRERGTFDTAANVVFYNLPTYLPSLLSYTIKDRDVINMMQYHLMEAANSWGISTTWGGTAQFTMADLEDSLERRQNQFLVDTGMVLTRSQIPQPAPPVGRAPLPDHIIDVRRAVWSGVGGDVRHLWREDEWAVNSCLSTWSSTPGTPYMYSIMGPPPLTIQIAPVPSDAGVLDIVTVNTGTALDVTSGVTMSVPDDWAWVVKWGALADILGKDGPAYDPERAAWCEKRYAMGVVLAREQACIVQAQLQGLEMFVDSLHNTDAAYNDWQDNASSTPTNIGVAGYNLIAVQPIPDGIYSITLDVIRKAPVPTDDGTSVQLGREQIDMILDYAEHLAMFKVGGEEFDATERQAENFVKQALLYNHRLSAAARDAVVSGDFSRKELRHRPRIGGDKALGTVQGAA